MNYNGFPVTYNPYLNGFMPQPMQQPIQQPMQQIQQPVPGVPQPTTSNVLVDDRIFVGGEQDAASWVVRAGQSVRLWDRNGQTFYVKAVSESGQPLPLEIYDYQKRGNNEPDVHVEHPTPFNPDDFVRRDEFDDFKRQITAKKKPVKKEEVIIDAEAE